MKTLHNRFGIGDLIARCIGNSKTKREVLVLQILSNTSKKVTGADILKASDGKLNRGTVYGLLERMENKQLIFGEESHKNKRRFPQRYYTLTQHGHKVLNDTKDRLLDDTLQFS